MPLPLTVSCSSKIQIGFTFLVPAYPGCPGKEAVKWLLLLLLLIYLLQPSKNLLQQVSVIADRPVRRAMPLALYTKVDTQCDKQTTVVGPTKLTIVEEW